MKNTKLLILSTILTLFLTSCGSSSNTHLSREEDSEEDISETSTTSTDASEGSGNTSISEEKTPLVSDLTEENYKSFITYYNAKFASLSSFKAITSSTFFVPVSFLEKNLLIKLCFIRIPPKICFSSL